jgi:small ligand-binding sensory domain FIST
MKFHSAVSSNDSTAKAIGEAVEPIRPRIGAQIDIAWVFFTAHHSAESELLVRSIRDELNPRVLVGCSAEGVIGGEIEIERQPGITILAGQLPGVQIHPLHIATDEWRPLLTDTESLRARLGLTENTRALIGFGDPWTTPLNQFMQALDILSPRAPLIGGMASAARSAGENVLLCNDERFDEGFVGVSLAGPIEVQTVVSQGARPIGEKFIITKGRDNLIEQLGGKPAMQVLRDMYEGLPQRDQELMQNGLLIGRAISEYLETFGRGDFLIRNITGIDQQAGSIALTDEIRVGQTIQFQVRDNESADRDLRLMLASTRNSADTSAALLFSCNGRGSRMFDEPNHDIAVSRQLMPKTPITGFFAAGEIGPVGGRNFIHGHTASFALIRPTRE